MFKHPELKIFENPAVTILPLSKKHSTQLFKASKSGEDEIFYHLFFGPFEVEAELENFIESSLAAKTVLTFSIFSKRLNQLVGTCSILNIDTESGNVELGSIWYAKKAQGTEINSNTIYLLLCYLFDELGYRRVVWKCDDTNEKSKAAALKLGFKFEGTFRKHLIIKGRNRDTAWFSIVNDDWKNTKKSIQSRLGKKSELHKKKYGILKRLKMKKNCYSCKVIKIPTPLRETPWVVGTSAPLSTTLRSGQALSYRRWFVKR